MMMEVKAKLCHSKDFHSNCKKKYLDTCISMVTFTLAPTEQK